MLDNGVLATKGRKSRQVLDEVVSVMKIVKKKWRARGFREWEEMKNDDSYKMGLLLGHLAQRVTYDITSFERGYVGLLSRHISTFEGFVGLGNFIKGKLSIHKRLHYKVKKRAGDIESILGKVDESSIPNNAEVSLKFDSFLTAMNPKAYNREHCACGFFEGYFAKYLKGNDQATQEDEEQMIENQEENQ